MLYIKWKPFAVLIDQEFSDYKLVGLTNKLNSRNAKSYADVINSNPSNIYLVEKKTDKC